MKSQEEQPTLDPTNGQTEVMSVAQIQRLVRLLDRSDISELELKLASEDTHLILRKVKAAEGTASADHVAYVASSNGASPSSGSSEPAGGTTRHKITAPLVGIFHPWLKPRGKALVAVGDAVKPGQVLCTVESLNVFNEIEATIAGRVAEIQVQNGQIVEYGQILMLIERSEAEDA